MLRMAIAAHDRHETAGQIQRLVGTPIAWLIGWVPKGNSGGADVSPFQPMPLPADMADDLADFEVSRDILTRIVVISVGLTVVYLVAS
jgi:arylesterase / paraoxonase